jgi:uncharacterized protein
MIETLPQKGSTLDMVRAVECGLNCEIDVKSTDIVAIITHPYALLGGSMNDHVVQTVKEHLLEASISTVTCNFEAGYGYAALQNDVVKLIDLAGTLKSKYKFEKVMLIGYSYGSVITLEAALDIDVDYIISISYPSQGMFFVTTNP